MRILLEALGLTEALKAIQQLETTAATKWDATEPDEEAGGQPYLVWGAKLYQYLWALETTVGEPKETIVAKDVVQILKATNTPSRTKTASKTHPRKRATFTSA